ncbi:hypothetical protein KUCAC02_020431 [Chaenocephalus aceratus]|nr:hypothetical protein KUCAC02_020431 [Chaenocephalus aceratus]
MTSLFSVGPPTSGLMVKKKKKDEAVIKEKMQRSFSLRRQEILQEPKIPEFLNKWPALFDVSEGIVVTEEGHVVRVATDHFRNSFKEKDVGRGDDSLELLDRQVPGDIVQALELTH